MKALEIFQRDKVTIMAGVPTMYVALAQYPNVESYDTPRCGCCVSGGASLPVEVLRGFDERFGCVLLEGYGLSETSPVASFNHGAGTASQVRSAPRSRAWSSGSWTATGTTWAQGDIGEIAIKGHNVMKGYHNRPDATAEVMNGEWFRTGDLARVDEDGYYFIVDRAKDMIIRGGFNVYPREIEEVLYEHPAVAIGCRGGRAGSPSMARRSPPPSRSSRVPPRPRTRSDSSSRIGSPPTSTRASSG